MAKHIPTLIIQKDMTHTIITPGCATALFSLHYALLDSGDEVIVPDPSHYIGGPTNYWSCFGSKVVPCAGEEDDNWVPDIDLLRSKISDRTKAIFINNPNNPTGAVYPEKFLSEIVDIAGENDLLLIGDEIYGLIIFDNNKAVSLGELAKDVPTIVMNGISKYFIRTGWRFGYLCLHDPDGKATEAMTAIKNSCNAYGHATRGMVTPVVAAAAQAFENAPLPSTIEFLKELKKRRDYIIKRIREIDGLTCKTPQATLYAFPKVENWQDDGEFLLQLLEEKHLLFNEGSSYGDSGKGHFRTLLMPDIDTQKEIWDRVSSFLKR
jgi:aspartate/methionine/tyrosine aminotransferase